MEFRFNWKDPDTYLNIDDMRAVLRDNGMSVQTEDRRNAIGKNEVHFWIYRNGRTLKRMLYEYGLGDIQQIQDHRKYFLQEIIDAFETAEKTDVARVHIMGICEMLAKLDDRGFKANSDYDPGKKVYMIHAHKGDWHCVRKVEWCDILDDDQPTIASHARQRQETLESIFEEYAKYERKMALNSLYGSRPLDLKSQYVWITTAGCGPDTPFEKMVKERIKEKEMKYTKQTYVMAKKDADYLNYGVADVMATMALNRKLTPSTKLPEIKKVVFNKPATIVIWADDTKTVVKAQNGETFDPEKGLAMAITKKALGNEGNYYDIIKKYIYPDTKQKEEEHSKQWLAYQRLQNALGDKKATKADLLAAMEEAIGYLGEALDE